MNSRGVPSGRSREFAAAVAVLADVPVRPEVVLEETPAPQRVAPNAVALTAEVSPPEQEPVAGGRFVVLHDPSAPEAWDGTWRVVTFARATLEPELAADPLLGEVGWSWLTEALVEGGVQHEALGGTVTRVVSDSFGTLADRAATVEMELRASWTPTGTDLDRQLRTWTDLLCTLGGLPPLPEGVSPFPGQQR